MGLNVWQRSFINSEGQALTGVQLSVYLQDGATLAPIFDEAGGVKGNPFNTGLQPVGRFYAAPGVYTIRAFKNGEGVAEWKDVEIGSAGFRAELGAPGSDTPMAGLPAQAVGFSVNSLVDLAGAPKNSGIVSVMRFFSDGPPAGNKYQWDPSRPASDHTGSTVLAQAALEGFDGLKSSGPFLFEWGGAGSGCWVAVGEINSATIGCTGEDDSGAVACFFSRAGKYLPVVSEVHVEKQTDVGADAAIVGVRGAAGQKPLLKIASLTSQRGIISSGGSFIMGGLRVQNGGICDQVVAIENKTFVFINENDFDLSHAVAALTGGLSGGIYGSVVSNMAFERNTFTGAWRDHDFNAGSPGGFGGNNLARAVNIANPAGQKNVAFRWNVWDNVWSAVYISNTSDLCFEKNTVRDTADSGFFDRCTGGFSKNKRFIFNDFFNIGKAPIKTLDTNNINPSAFAEDAIIYGNNFYGWGMLIESECVLAARGYSGGYVRQELKNKNVRIEANNFIQSEGSLTKRFMLLCNLDGLYVGGNKFKLVEDDKDNDVYLAQWCRNVDIHANDFRTDSTITLAYRNEGSLTVRDNIFNVGDNLVIEGRTDGVSQNIKLTGNLIRNSNPAPFRHFALLVRDIGSSCDLVFDGNRCETLLPFEDSNEAASVNMIGLSYDMPRSIDNNIVVFSGGVVKTQKMIAGDILNPVYYAGTAGASRNTGGGTLLFKPTSARTDTRTVSST